LQHTTHRVTGLCNENFESHVCATSSPRVAGLCNLLVAPGCVDAEFSFVCGMSMTYTGTSRRSAYSDILFARRFFGTLFFS
jgi:hypothetical protein